MRCVGSCVGEVLLVADVLDGAVSVDLQDFVVVGVQLLLIAHLYNFLSIIREKR